VFAMIKYIVLGEVTRFSLTSGAFTLSLWVTVFLGIWNWQKIGGDRWSKALRTGFRAAFVLTCLLAFLLLVVGLS